MPAKAPALWYPKAKVVAPLPTRGVYPKGFPQGAVVHYTAGAYGLSELDLARQVGYAYLLIDERGGVHQGHSFDRWGSHAGKSSWPGITGNVSSSLVGIEIDCAGALTPDGKGNFKTWWGKIIPHDEVRIVTADANRKHGAYHRYTEEQEQALTELLLWLHAEAPDTFNLDWVVGHDEVAPDRKWDPGGSLSTTMPAYRQHLKAMAQARAAGAAAPQA